MNSLPGRIKRLENQGGAGGLVICLLPLHLTAEEKAQRLQEARAQAGMGGEVVEIVGIDPDGETEE